MTPKEKAPIRVDKHYWKEKHRYLIQYTNPEGLPFIYHYITIKYTSRDRMLDSLKSIFDEDGDTIIATFKIIPKKK